MQIPKEYLEEKNYTGTRLIEVNDETVLDLKKQLDELQKEINPVLDRLNENYYKPADQIYTEINALNEKLNPLKEKMRELFEANKADTEIVEAQEKKAQHIKNKIQPIVNELVKSELGEFEKATIVREVDGKLFVEVVDEIEEKIKSIRSANAKTK